MRMHGAAIFSFRKSEQFPKRIKLFGFSLGSFSLFCHEFLQM